MMEMKSRIMFLPRVSLILIAQREKVDKLSVNSVVREVENCEAIVHEIGGNLLTN
jgi:hypothetical protein